MTDEEVNRFVQELEDADVMRIARKRREREIRRVKRMSDTAIEVLDLTTDRGIAQHVRPIPDRHPTAKGIVMLEYFFVIDADGERHDGEPGDVLAIGDDDTPERPHRWVIKQLPTARLVR